MTLKEYKATKGVSYRAIANACNVAYATIYNIARGITQPSKKLALKIQQVTGGLVTYEELRSVKCELVKMKPGVTR